MVLLPGLTGSTVSILRRVPLCKGKCPNTNPWCCLRLWAPGDGPPPSFRVSGLAPANTWPLPPGDHPRPTTRWPGAGIFLVTERSRAITGQSIDVNGGECSPDHISHSVNISLAERPSVP